MWAALRRWRYAIAWAGWALYFAVVEGLALRNKTEGDTLSEFGWRLGSLKDKGRAWRLRRLAFLTLLVWLVLHILTGGFF